VFKRRSAPGPVIPAATRKRPVPVAGAESRATSPARCKDPASRYSTYVIAGLPPGPIANPGAASLKAALNPDPSPEAREYLFFVAARDGSGAHVFTKNFDDHKAAIKRHLKP
jgi:UPF0755 protein